MSNQLDESKFVQQHLANERTFLAWIRTSITIIGLGFVSAGIVFGSTPFGHIGHLLSAIVGIGSVLFGGIVAAMATKDYFRKRDGINGNQFRSPSLLIWIMFATLGIINIFLIVLVGVLVFY